MCRLVQVSGALLAVRKEAEEKERQRREQLEQQHALQAALAQRQKVSLTHKLQHFSCSVQHSCVR